MKKLKILVFALFAFITMETGMGFATNTPIKATDGEVVYAHCEITDSRGFHASGNCRKVLRAYSRWLELRK